MIVAHFASPCHSPNMVRAKLGLLCLATLAAGISAAQTSPNKHMPYIQLPWHQNVRMFHFPELFAKDLFAEGESLEKSLSTSQSKYVILDFYAPWCPHCQHFAPDFERLALAINSSKSETKKPQLEAGVVDCVKYMEACKKFGVSGFPSLKYGKRTDFMKLNTSGIQDIVLENRSAETVAQWLQNQSELAISIDTSTVSKEDVTKQLLTLEGKSNKPTSGVGSARRTGGDVWDAKLGAAMLLRSIFETQEFEALSSGQSEDVARATLFQVLGLFSRNFPEHNGGTCRKSFLDLSDNLANKWETHLTKHFFLEGMGESTEKTYVNPDIVEGEWQMCNLAWDNFSSGWGACRGSWPQKRGYTCGLWTLMHFSAAGSNDASASRDTEILRSMIHQFFDCTECRDHFDQIPYEKSMIQSREDMQLWWWDAHNQVNERVAKIEQDGEDGDPAFPKMQFPSKELCPECHVASLLRTEMDKPHHKHYNHHKAHHASHQHMYFDSQEPALLRNTLAAKGWNVEALEQFLAR